MEGNQATHCKDCLGGGGGGGGGGGANNEKRD